MLIFLIKLGGMTGFWHKGETIWGNWYWQQLHVPYWRWTFGKNLLYSTDFMWIVNRSEQFAFYSFFQCVLHHYIRECTLHKRVCLSCLHMYRCQYSSTQVVSFTLGQLHELISSKLTNEILFSSIHNWQGYNLFVGWCSWMQLDEVGLQGSLTILVM